MDREKLTQRLMATFLGELDDHVGSLERDVLALERAAEPDARSEIVSSVLRSAHSLKGAARAVALGEISELCHGVEDLLASVRDGARELAPADIEALLAAVDALREVHARLRRGEPGSAPELAVVAQRLARAAAAADAPFPGAAIATPIPVTVPLVAGAPSASMERAPPATPVSAAPAGSVRVSTEKLEAIQGAAYEVARAWSAVGDIRERLDGIAAYVTRCETEWRCTPSGEDVRAGRGAAAGGTRIADQLRWLRERVDELAGALSRRSRSVELSLARLDGETQKLRRVPLSEACAGLTRVARDVARWEGKEVALTVEGGGVELDGAVVAALRDPLQHLVRNAVAHGIERERGACGKPRCGQIALRASLRGSEVEIQVADDGRGLDLAAIRDQARRQGIPLPDAEAELASLVFEPGFTTSRNVTETSGRGVGLDVVRSRLESIHGAVDLSFAAGRGTTFTLRVPLTLTRLRALLLQVAGQEFALPSTTVRRVLRIDLGELRTVEGRSVLLHRGASVLVHSLGDVLGMDAGGAPPPYPQVPAVIVAAGDRQMAFVVDATLAEQEVVVRGLGSRLRRVRHVAGAALLASGRIALVLNAGELIRSTLGLAGAGGLAKVDSQPPRPKRILVADDTLTTRTLVKILLESAGYDVIAASDGDQAWRVVQDREVDLVVSDVDMPGRDGYALTEAIRGSRRLRDLPVVLVTGLDEYEGKARGIEVGANAYLVKSSFDQSQLLQVIEQLLGPDGLRREGGAP
jgi:two-component system, chemotaxis family, sensor kinase CheA